MKYSHRNRLVNLFATTDTISVIRKSDITCFTENFVLSKKIIPELAEKAGKRRLPRYGACCNTWRGEDLHREMQKLPAMDNLK